MPSAALTPGLRPAGRLAVGFPGVIIGLGGYHRASLPVVGSHADSVPLTFGCVNPSNHEFGGIPECLRRGVTLAAHVAQHRPVARFVCGTDALKKPVGLAQNPESYDWTKLLWSGDNRPVSVTGQAGYPDSDLCKFLNARLPQRKIIAQEWAERARNAPWSGINVSGEHRKQLGMAIEIRIGLDLAEAPGYWDALSFLPPAECRALLQGAGYSPGASHLADSGTTDPLLRHWTRASHPLACGDEERAILASCWDAAGMREIAYGQSLSAELCRSILIHVRGDFAAAGSASFPESAVDGLVHLWQGYLAHGRRPLMALGSRVFLEPELALGLGRADLVAGRCLVDIKTALDPSRYFEQWLNQVLGYTLLDWANILCLDAVAIYLGWQALLLCEPITGLLAASVPGPTPALEGLRADFRSQIQPEVDESFNTRMRHRYPIPPSPQITPSA